MASADDETREPAMRRYGRARGASSPTAGGYAAESEAAAIASSLGLPERVLGQPLGTLSGGQRRRVELARILFRGARDAAARRADQPPRRRLDRLAARLPRSHKGGLVVISHDVGLLEHVVNRVFHLDANRAALDVYNVGWKPYLAAARDRRARGASASAPTPRSRRRRSWRRPTGCAPRRPRPRPRRTWPSAPSGCSPGWRRRAGATGSRSCASPSPRRAAGRR